MATIEGLISGLDTGALVEGLLEIRKRRIDLLEVRKTETTTRQTALKQIESRLLAFRGEAARLARTADNPIVQRTVEVSDEDAISATASRRAAVGVHRLRVLSLAQSHQVASQGFANPEAEITTGTISLRVGDGDTQTLTIDASNNTLQGLADAINASDAGVTAAVIRDDADPAAPHRLLLSARETGADQVISLTNGLGASTGGAVRPEIDFDNPVQAAGDAQVQIGSGPGAITLRSATNTITELAPGLTLNLKSADPAREITVRVDQDSKAALDAVQSFVDSFNELTGLFEEHLRYSPETDEAGVLFGNRTVVELQQAVRGSILSVVPGVAGGFNRLSAIGVSVTDSGRLTLDSSRLTDVLEGRVAGAGPEDVRRLFGVDGRSTHGGVQFVGASSRTKADGTLVEVHVTRAAERASLTAGAAAAASTVIDGTNDELTLQLDGATATIRLVHGTYTSTELAERLQAAINGAEALNGRTASVAAASDVLTVTSASYGASSAVTLTSGTALTALGFTGGSTDVGVDVAGEFLVDGQTETATGRGRLLSGGADNESTADLQVRVSLQNSQLGPGPEAELTLTRGVAGRLDQLLGRLLDPVDGRIKTASDGFADELESLQQSIDQQNEFFSKQQQRLIDEFTALETVISQLQTTGNFLTAQLSNLPTLQRR